MKRFFNIAIVLFLASGLFLTAQNAVASQPKIVASTSWVGAIVKAAGIDDVTVLATIDMRHPSEYDFKPSDIQLALEADYIVWAGYEPFIQRLIEVANIPEEKLIIVFTNNTPPLLRDTVLSVAQRFGTTEKASLWVEELEKLAQTLSDNATKLNVHEKRVVVQFHQRTLLNG